MPSQPSTRSGKSPLRYFVSYAHADHAKVDQLLELLYPLLASSKSRSYVGWRDTTCLLPGENWDAEIQSAASVSGLGLLMLSPSFLTRPYILREELPRLQAAGKCVIPVLIKEVDFSLMEAHGLEALQYFGLRRGARQLAFSRLRQADQRESFALDLFRGIEARLNP